jgi:hypothetical protein
LLSLMAFLFLVAWASSSWRRLAATTRQPQPAVRAAKSLETSTPAPLPSAESLAEPSLRTTHVVPRATLTRRHGSVWLVDLGVTSLRLHESLTIQRTLATAKGERLMLMISGASCRGCDGFDALLDDPVLQRRLGALRLVRVDVGAFEQELERLRVPTDVRPAFFLLDEQLTPRDGIHHREWSDPSDAREVSHVLARFLDGLYLKRRHEWAPVRGSVRL